jgi:hypothetical protein
MPANDRVRPNASRSTIDANPAYNGEGPSQHLTPGPDGQVGTVEFAYDVRREFVLADAAGGGSCATPKATAHRPVTEINYLTRGYSLAVRSCRTQQRRLDIPPCAGAWGVTMAVTTSPRRLCSRLGVG